MAKLYLFLGSEEHQPETQVQLAVAAESAGFDGVVISEHFHPWVDDLGSSGFAFSTLGAIAQATERLEMLMGVVTPLWRFHPGVVAQAAATLDRLSGGRFSLGVGTGENINEGPLGYDFPAYAERAARMREALEVIRRLLDQEKLTFNGTYYQTDRAKLYSPSNRRVPVYLAAGGPKSAALAGEMADGVMTSVKDIQQTREKVLDPMKRVNPSAKVITTRWVIYAKDDREAWQVLKPSRGLRAPTRLEAVDPKDLREWADAAPRQEVIGKFARAVSPDEIVEQFRPLITDLNADIVGMQVASLDSPRTISMLGEKVLPALRSMD